MAIIRTKRPTSFTVINNDLLNDTRLDWRDLGLLTYLLSKPDNWEVSVAHLQKIRKTGRYAIYESLKNLTAAGYVKGRAKQGGFEYEVFDVPTIHLAENHDAENHDAENHDAENHDAENHDAGFHHRENPTQVNTDYLINTETTVNTELLNDSKSISDKSYGDLGVHRAPKFKKPTVLELEAFCNETHINIDCQHFIDYYESNGWKVSKVAMKDWKAAVRNWARREHKNTRGNYAGNTRPDKPQSANDKVREVINAKYGHLAPKPA